MARVQGRGYAATIHAAELSRTEWERLIAEWVYNERDRYILVRHLLDGVRYADLVDELDERFGVPLTERRIAAVVRNGITAISKHMP